MNHELEGLLLVHDVANELGCTPDNVRHLERTGKLAAIRIGGMRVFRATDVTTFKRERAQRRKVVA